MRLFMATRYIIIKIHYITLHNYSFESIMSYGL